MKRAEQCTQEHKLCVAGVLVFVEQHSAIRRSLGCRDFGKQLGEIGRERHLIGEVETFAPPFGFVVGRHDRQQLATRSERSRHPSEVFVQVFGRSLGGRLRQRSEHGVQARAVFA